MANLEFRDTHNMVAYLKKTKGSEGFHQIVDFLNTSHIRYALTENSTIYVSLIQQFWQTATASTLDNGEIEITATIDRKIKIVTKASIRRHIKLEDSKTISNLPTTEIFEQLALRGSKKTAWEQFSSNIATAIICLAINGKFNFSKLIFDGMVKNLDINTSLDQAAGSKDRPPMLGPGRYSQWHSRFLRYLDTKSNGEYLRKCIFEGPYMPTNVLIAAVEAAENILPVAAHEEAETIHNMTAENKLYFQAEKEAIFLILTGIGDEIYSTVDACNTAKEMWTAIERLQQGESLNVQDVKTNLFWEFGKFTSRDGESMESYYSRFYKLMNELTRNNLQVSPMQVNVQFLQQLQPEWSRFVTVVKQRQEIDTVSYHKLFDVLKQFQNEVNDIRSERLARSANPLALLAAAQPYSDNYYQAPKPQRSNAPSYMQSSSTRPSASTRHKGKEIAKPVTPQSESVSEEDSDPEQARRDKDMQKNLALLLIRSATKWDYSAFTGKGFGHYARMQEAKAVVKDYAYHKRDDDVKNMLEQGVPLQAEQADWLEDIDEEIDEQELEAHYNYMAKIQEVSPAESSSTDTPLEQFRPRTTTTRWRLLKITLQAPFLNVQMMSVHISSGLVLHQMTSDHNRSELGIQDHSNEQSSSKLVPKVVVRLGINPMIQPEPEDLPKDNPKLEIAVLRYDWRLMYMGIMPTKIELTLEQSQQGVSNDVLVSIEGVEE
ncbi:hypothetical protein Tco_0609296 [Tanacetum coccineum]